MDSFESTKVLAWLCAGVLSTVRSQCSTEGLAFSGHWSVKTVLLTFGYNVCFCFCGRMSFELNCFSILIDSTQTAFVMTLKRVLLQFAETLMEMKLDLNHHNL